MKTFVASVVAAVLAVTGTASAQNKDANAILVASTTSTENSGLFGHILPIFTKETGIKVNVVAKGTGQAILLAKNGDADVLFVHDKPSEEKFVAEGYGVKRQDVMYNDFVIVGPQSDPAQVGGMRDAPKALGQIADAKAPFVSRGDNSGTNSAEKRLWQDAEINPKEGSGGWYREAGAGMGATLNIASAMNGYTLTDRGTWLSFKNKGDLKVLVEGDPRMFNQYGVIVVNPKKYPHVKADAASRFANWVTGPKGQAAIASYKINGDQLFFANAAK